MGVISYISSIFEKRASKSTGGNPQSPSYWVQKLFGATGNTAAGVNVNEQSALSSTAIWRAVSLVSQTIGALPLHMYERDGNRAKNKAINHQLYKTMHDEPNPEQTAMEFREMLQAHALTWGRAHAEIQVDSRGKIRLWPITPDRVEPMRTKDRDSLVYRVHLPDGGHRILLADEIFTLKGLGYGLNSTYNVIQLFRESIGLTLAAEEFGARFFGNGATMGGILEHPGKLNEESFKHLKESMDERHKGLSNAHRLLILEEGMKYQEIAVPPDKAQYIETRRYQINDVARIIGVPPHKLAEMSQATFSNIEHQTIEFVQDTINPWCVRWEQGLSRQLLSDTEKQKYFFKHNLSGLMRGDFKTRMEGYSIGRQNGWLSANDIREMEDMNPVNNGDIYLIPLNMVSADQAAATPILAEPEDEPEPTRSLREKRSNAASRMRLNEIYKPLIRNAVEEIIKRERADILREAEKVFKNRDYFAFNEKLMNFYEDHKEFMSKKITPVMTSFAEAVHAAAAEEIDVDPQMTERHRGFLNAYITGFIARHVTKQSLRMSELAKSTEPIEALEAEFDQIQKTGIDGIANEQSVQAGAAFAKFTFLAGGITKLVWVANSDACEFCSTLNGKVVGIQESFVTSGESVSSSTGANSPMAIGHNIGHPPLHGGCQCNVLPQ